MNASFVFRGTNASSSKCALDFVDRIQSWALKFIGDDRIVSSITSLGDRRNVSCIVISISTILEKNCRLSELIPPLQVFTRNTRLSGRSHAFTVATMSHRTTHYRENSFFTRTASLWNDLPANIFPECFNISVFKARVNQHFLLSPPSI